MHTVQFTADELNELIAHLAEAGMEMDDDGRAGAFDASPLKPIYDKLRHARARGEA